MKKGRYIYQYCFSYQVNFKMIKIDGIAQMENRIVSQSDYLDLKSQIAPEIDGKGTIDSLSYLGREFE